MLVLVAAALPLAGCAFGLAAPPVRVSSGVTSRVVRGGGTASVDRRPELARFTHASGCSGGFDGGARGDLGVALFAEGATAQIGDLRITTTTLGLALRAPGFAFFGMEHGTCEGAVASER